MQRFFMSTILIAIVTSVSLAMGAVPQDRITDDTAIYQKVSYIRAKKTTDLNFDSGMKSLSQKEGRYREKLPRVSRHKRLKKPVKRVRSSKYAKKYKKNRSRRNAQVKRYRKRYTGKKKKLLKKRRRARYVSKKRKRTRQEISIDTQLDAI